MDTIQEDRLVPIRFRELTDTEAMLLASFAKLAAHMGHNPFDFEPLVEGKTVLAVGEEQYYLYDEGAQFGGEHEGDLTAVSPAAVGRNSDLPPETRLIGTAVAVGDTLHPKRKNGSTHHTALALQKMGEDLGVGLPEIDHYLEDVAA